MQSTTTSDLVPASSGADAAATRAPLNLRSLLDEMISKGASDLHITAGERPKLRIDGSIVHSQVEHVLTPKDPLMTSRYPPMPETADRRAVRAD